MPVISKHAEDLLKFEKVLCEHGGNTFCVFNNIELNVALVLIKTNNWAKRQEKKTNLYEATLTQEGEIRACRFVTPFSQDSTEVIQNFKSINPQSQRWWGMGWALAFEEFQQISGRWERTWMCRQREQRTGLYAEGLRASGQTPESIWTGVCM